MHWIRWRGGAPWTDVYGLARTLLATGTLLTLLANRADVLFHPLGARAHEGGIVSGILQASLFSLAPDAYLELARWAAIGVLLVVASGWRPRITGVLHWWISFSVAVSVVPIDGGDQLTAVLTLLLLPVTLTDARRWHWSAPTARAREYPVASDVARSALWIVRLQVALVYLHASVGKMAVPEWADGTALYYWLSHPLFGVVEPLQPIVQFVLAAAWPVLLLTWSVIVFELLLFTALVQPRHRWGALLALGLVFHLGIAVLQGLVSFFFAMAGALVLFLRPVERPFQLAAFAARMSAGLATPLRPRLRSPSLAVAPRPVGPPGRR